LLAQFHNVHRATASGAAGAGCVLHVVKTGEGNRCVSQSRCLFVILIALLCVKKKNERLDLIQHVLTPAIVAVELI